MLKSKIKGFLDACYVLCVLMVFIIAALLTKRKTRLFRRRLKGD